MINTKYEYFRTQSLALSTAIQVASTAKLVKVERIPNSRKVIFCFDPARDQNFQSIIDCFYAHQLPIDAATYFDALKFIKSRLYEEQL